MRFAYAYTPETEEEYEAAINEALDQAEGLEWEAGELQQEARRWYDRVDTLWLEYYEKFPVQKEHPVGPGQIELNPDFFEEDNG